MASLPDFKFPFAQQAPGSEDSETVSDTASQPKREKPHMSLQIAPREGKGYTLSVPNARYPRPGPMRTVSTPPESPVRPRALTLGANQPQMHDSGAVTPPPTPTTHSKNNSISSIRSFLGCPKQGEVLAKKGEPKQLIDDSIKQGNTVTLLFDFGLTDYDIVLDHGGKKKTLGSGLWSDVYLATPCAPRAGSPVPTSLATPPPSLSLPIPVPGADSTPPLTPIHSRKSSLTKPSSVLPSAYAVKFPATTSANKVLTEEARILSYLTRFPWASDYVVGFYGQDLRNDALVLEAMDCTLEEWMKGEASSLDEVSRAEKLAKLWPAIAQQLVEGLQWMQERGCTHADIKPANILTSTDPLTGRLRVVFTDFSSASISVLDALSAGSAAPTTPKTPLGGGTWDFLDPVLLQSPSASAPTPNATSDTWSLAITLLYLIIGGSPFDCAGANQFRRREFVKHGDPMACVGMGDDARRNLDRVRSLSRALGWDVKSWLGKVLEKDLGKRVGLEEWMMELHGALGMLA